MDTYTKRFKKHLDLYGVCHDQRQEHPHGPQHVGEEALHFFNMSIFLKQQFLRNVFKHIMGMPWFAMISDKNIRMNLNKIKKKPLIFFFYICVFLKAAVY